MIYEDDTFIAFLDIFPSVKGHVLVIPKHHYRWVYEVPEFGKYWEVTKTIGLKMKDRLSISYIGFLTSGEQVPHAHIHILPEAKGITFGAKISISPPELADLAKLLR